MQFDLVSPERRLASFEATEVQIPGADGDMTAMADHAPTITTLRPGVLTAKGAGEEQAFFVTGGFAEIGSAGVSVLAERAMPTGEVTQDIFDGLLGDAVKARDSASTDAADSAAKLVADMVAAGGEIGLNASVPNL